MAGKFDDMGFLGKNEKRVTDKHPHMTGVLNFSRETLERLFQELEDDGAAKVQLAAWRKDDDPTKWSLKIDKPFKKDPNYRSKPAAGTARRLDDEPREALRPQAKQAIDPDDPWG